MNEWPVVDLIVISYDRLDEIGQTLKALADNIQYPKGRLRLIIADDGTPREGYEKALIARVEEMWCWHRMRPIEYAPRDRNIGWGANANRALRASTAPYIFQIEDDYLLKRPLNLEAAIATMEVTPHIGMMRFRGTAGDHLVFHQMESDISQWLPDYREGVGLPGKLTYFLIDSGSPGLYIYSHGAHLKRASFHQHYGYYPEGLKLGYTEESYAHMVKDMMKTNVYSPVIAIQPDWISMYFDHIGKSYQLGELDKGRGII